jgi:hypothetical protein
MTFHKLNYGSTTKVSMTEEEVREELSTWYLNIDEVIHAMKTDKATPVAKSPIAVYWYGA